MTRSTAGTTLIGLIGDTHYPEAGPLWDCAYERLAAPT